MVDFIPFPKIPRLKRSCVITEKIDGTNACVVIGEDGEFRTASRSRWITPEDDNYGFSRWAHEHKDELMTLGPGQHFGEWFGSGVQRTYGLKEKRFALFNVGRWNAENKPACCYLVPILFQGDFSTERVDQEVERLRVSGSVAVPGFMRAEGVIVYLPAAREMFKVTVERDSEPKGLAA